MGRGGRGASAADIDELSVVAHARSSLLALTESCMAMVMTCAIQDAQMRPDHQQRNTDNEI